MQRSPVDAHLDRWWPLGVDPSVARLRAKKRRSLKQVALWDPHFGAGGNADALSVSTTATGAAGAVTAVQRPMLGRASKLMTSANR